MAIPQCSLPSHSLLTAAYYRRAQSIAKDGGGKPEYPFDYTKAKPNRFAKGAQPGSLAVVLDPDVAMVFKDAESVNAVLRALLTTMPAQRVAARRIRKRP